MAASSDEWELSKENIQPLQQGRKPEVLKVALTSEDFILQKRQAFENELRTYTGNDPLSVWCDYIKWVEQNFPKGGRDGHIGQLIQQCLHILKDKSEYYDDKRFVEIWLKFANLSSKPTDVYNYMYSHKIGCKSAAFFIAWSWELENQGNISVANQILNNGICHKAEPIERLKSYRSDFEMRIASKVMGDSRQEDEGEPHRSAFSVLKPQKKNLAPVVRTGDSVVASRRANVIIGRQQPLPKQNVPSVKVPFKIYNAENIAPPLPVQSENAIPFILHSDSSKENEKKPSKWNKIKVKQMPSGSRLSEAGDPGFKLHCDEVAPPVSTPRSVPKVSNILRTRQECPPPPLALFEPPDPMKKPMYDKDKVYGGAEEFSFEEIRAAAWVKKKNIIEKEKQIAEQQRILHEQEEQIKKLLQQVEILKSNQQPDVPKQSNLVENKSIDKLSSKNASVNSQSSYFNYNKPNVEISQDPSIATIQRELFPNTNLASTFRDASYMVRDLYNDTFYHQTDNLASTENLLIKSNHQNINCTSSDQKVNKFHGSVSSVNYDASAEPDSQIEQHLSCESAMPFKLYCDPTEHTSQFKSKELDEPLLLKQTTTKLCAPNNTLEENEKGDVENIPPQGYVQEINKRELSGILQPSKNIMYVPLELQECEEEDSGEEEYLYTENNNNPVQNETLIPPCNTEQFVSAAFLSSTPRTQLKVEKKLILQNEDHRLKNFASSKSFDPSNQNCNPAHLQSSLEDITSNKEMGKSDARMSLKDYSTFPQNTGQLSVIMETSRECYKSSSSSGSSASITKLSHLEQCFSHEKSNVQKHLSKVDIFKGQRPVIQGRDASHSHNERENTFDAFKEPRPVSKKSNFQSTNSKSENILKEPKSQDEREDFSRKTNVKQADTPKDINKIKTVPEDKRKFELHCTDINPFDADLNTKVLQAINLPDDYYSNFHASQKVIRNLEVNDEVKFGDFICVVENLVSEGAYGKVYEAKKQHLSIQNNGSCHNSKVALKVCKRMNDWEYYICYILHKRLAEISSNPDVRLSVMEIISAHRYSNDLVLVSEFSSQGTLLDLVNYYKQQNFGVPECITMYLTFEMLHIMAKVHECKIVHGDVKPDNILLRDSISVFDVSGSFSQKTAFLKLIDFGRAIDLSVLKPGVCFKTVMKDGCIEMKENKPWVFQIDWFGLLNCIHVLLFSEYMKVKKNSNGRWIIEKKFKRYWDQTLWVPLFDELLNIPSCYEEPNVLKYTKLIESKLKTNEQTFKVHFQRLTNFNMKK